MIINVSEQTIQKARKTNKVTELKVIALWQELMFNLKIYNKNELIKLRNNVISGLLVLGINQDIIINLMVDYDLEYALNNYTVEELNGMIF